MTSIAVLRRVYRSFCLFESFVEAGGSSDLVFRDGDELVELCYWDLKSSMERVLKTCTSRQQEAFTKSLIEGRVLNEVRQEMGYSDVVPVQQYTDVVLGKIQLLLEGERESSS